MTMDAQPPGAPGPDASGADAHDDVDLAAAGQVLGDAVRGADDGELFLQSSWSETLSWDDGKLKVANRARSRGFGLRVVAGEAVGYGHAGERSIEAMKRAAEAAAGVRGGRAVHLDVGPARANRAVYDRLDPVSDTAFLAKTDLLARIDAYLRARDPRVVQATVTMSSEVQDVTILRPEGQRIDDYRPLMTLGVSVTVEQHGRRESAMTAGGGRVAWTGWFEAERWRQLADNALRVALLNLEAVPAPSGEMDVVLGSGWPAVMLHEAVGHGLEGDANRLGSSVFSGRIGEQVAARGVTVIDDGGIDHMRGSLTVDDEGTPTGETVLIEDGVLKGYMQDRMNARLTGVRSTGNGRRQNYASAPLPRMTNTYMRAGGLPRDEVVAALRDGVYAADFGGGQVDTTSGKFVFSCTEAYLVENGRIIAPIKGATLIGDGPRAMAGIRLIGDDLAFDRGVGTCGKAGQSVPVGLGQPTVYMTGLTVGGG